jgi:hypothetical protein
VHKLHDENGFRGGRQVFAKLFVPTDTRLVDLEVGTQLVDFNDADVIFLDYTTMRERLRLQREQQE